MCKQSHINLHLLCRMAVWSQAWYIVIPLVLVILGHWSLLLHGTPPLLLHCYLELICLSTGVLIEAAWVPGTGCMITDTDNTLLAATFIYTMVFDFTVLLLNAWKLVRLLNGRKQSSIMQLIFHDGLIFFIIS